MKIKTIFQSIFFLSLLCSIGFWLINGKKGYRTYRTLKKECNQEEDAVKQLEENIKNLKDNIDQWKESTLQQEKMVRQDLGMSCTNELVYLIPDK